MFYHVCYFLFSAYKYKTYSYQTSNKSFLLCYCCLAVFRAFRAVGAFGNPRIFLTSISITGFLHSQNENHVQIAAARLFSLFRMTFDAIAQYERGRYGDGSKKCLKYFDYPKNFLGYCICSSINWRHNRPMALYSFMVFASNYFFGVQHFPGSANMDGAGLNRFKSPAQYHRITQYHNKFFVGHSMLYALLWSCSSIMDENGP